MFSFLLRQLQNPCSWRIKLFDRNEDAILIQRLGKLAQDMEMSSKDMKKLIDELGNIYKKENILPGRKRHQMSSQTHK